MWFVLVTASLKGSTKDSRYTGYRTLPMVPELSSPFVGFFCIRPGVWFQILLLLSLVYFAYRWIQHALLKGDQPCLYVSGFMQPMLLRIMPVTVVVVSGHRECVINDTFPGGQYIALLMAASFAIWNNVSYWLLSKIVYRCMYSKVNNRLDDR